MTISYPEFFTIYGIGVGWLGVSQSPASRVGDLQIGMQLEGCLVYFLSNFCTVIAYITWKKRIFGGIIVITVTKCYLVAYYWLYSQVGWHIAFQGVLYETSLRLICGRAFCETSPRSAFWEGISYFSIQVYRLVSRFFFLKETPLESETPLQNQVPPTFSKKVVSGRSSAMWKWNLSGNKTGMYFVQPVIEFLIYAHFYWER